MTIDQQETPLQMPGRVPWLLMFAAVYIWSGVPLLSSFRRFRFVWKYGAAELPSAGAGTRGDCRSLRDRICPGGSRSSDTVAVGPNHL